MDVDFAIAIAGLVVASVGLIVFPVVATWRISKVYNITLRVVKENKSKIDNLIERFNKHEVEDSTRCSEFETKIDLMWEVMVQDALTETWKQKLGKSKSPTSLTPFGKEVLGNNGICLSGKIDCMIENSNGTYSQLKDPELTMLLFVNFSNEMTELAKIHNISLRAILGAALAYAKEKIKGE